MGKETIHSLVLSDLHFGDTRCTLHSMGTAHALTNRLQHFRPISEIVLLGDILDLQLANWARAVEGMILPGGKRTVGFRYFLNFLIKETGARKIIYVPGNHDYRIFDYHSIEKSLIRTLRKGKKLSGKIAFFRTFEDSFLRGILTEPETSIKIVYPHHTVRVNGTRLILTHGHFFDPTQAFNHEVGKVFAGSGSLSRRQIAKLRHDYFRRASLYQNLVCGFSMRKEIRQWFSSIYHPFTALTNRIAHRSRKTFLTPAMRRSIEHYVTFCCRPGNAVGVVFGHTHKPGKAMIQSGPVRCVWNAGTFLRESSSSPLGSYITIRHDRRSRIEDAVQVHIL